MRLIDYQSLCYYFDLNDTKKDSDPQYGVRDYWKGSLYLKTTKLKEFSFACSKQQSLPLGCLDQFHIRAWLSQ